MTITDHIITWRRNGLTFRAHVRASLDYAMKHVLMPGDDLLSIRSVEP